MTEDKTTTNPKYLAYCKAHGEPDPEAMLERDRVEWPGGCMTGFILWIGEKAREFDAEYGGRDGRSCAPHSWYFREFDAFVLGGQQ